MVTKGKFGSRIYCKNVCELLLLCDDSGDIHMTHDNPSGDTELPVACPQHDTGYITLYRVPQTRITVTTLTGGSSRGAATHRVSVRWQGIRQEAFHSPVEATGLVWPQ